MKKSKTRTSIVAVAVVLLTLCLVFAAPVSAGTTVTYSGGGEGTVDKPYVIKTVQDLKNLSIATNEGQYNYLPYYFELGNNIDLTTEENWTPIGTASYGFKGSFDGNGFTISNLKITNSGSKNVGLFGHIISVPEGEYSQPNGAWIPDLPGIVKDLTVNNVYINVEQHAVGGIVGSSSGVIQNCNVTGLIQISGTGYVGGVVGHGEEGSVTICAVTGTTGSYIKGVYKDSNNKGHKVGGVVGYKTVNTHPSFTVWPLVDLSVQGVSVSGSGQVGGLVGYINTAVPVTDCSVTDTSVTLTYFENFITQFTDADKQKYLTVGTFAGTAASDSTITNPLVTGDSGVFIDDTFNENDVAHISVGFIGDNKGILSNIQEAAFSYSSLADLAKHGLLAEVGYCKVTFDSTDGSAVDAQFIKSGEVVIQPEQPTKKDHTFAGWYNGETEWNFETTTVTVDTTLSAKWIKNEYTITPSITKVGFDSVKVGYTQPEAQTVTITNDGNAPVTLTAPTSENYAISLDKTTLAVGETALLTIQPEEGLAVGNYADKFAVTNNAGEKVEIEVSFLVYQPSSGGSSKPVEEPEEPVEPETPEEPSAGEVTTETAVSNGGEVAFETPAAPETPEAGEPSEGPADKPAEPVVTGVVLPEGTDSKVTFIPVSEKPAPAGKEQQTKKVFEINVPTYEKGKPATVKFTMTVAELAKDGKTAADVALWHQDEETGEWTKLVISYTIIDGVVYFEAITHDFSPFAIVYEDAAVEEPTEEPTEEPASPAPILAVLAGLGAAAVLRRK